MRRGAIDATPPVEKTSLSMHDDDFRRLVDDTLARDLEESLPGSGFRPLQPFEDYVAEAIKSVDAQFQRRVALIEQPPPPHVLTLKSWQHGFTAASTRDAAERAREEALFLRLQAYGSDRLSTREWRRCLDAFDRPARWIELARAHEGEGQWIRANADLAAARWLDPEGTRADADALRAARPEGLPRRLAVQPDPTWRGERFGQRHWRAWDMKNYALLDLPTLVDGASDENFSVRTRVYRSLGQRPHPASIQCLREGTLDPHFFARAQAVRSLGWCVDPTAPALLAELARRDPHPEVRRTAEKARQRIVAYWLLFGRWSEVFASAEASVAAARGLIAEGLPEAAADCVGGYWREDGAEAKTLYRTLRPGPYRRNPEREYNHWFEDAQREEAALAAADDGDAALAAAIRGDDPTARARALYVVSRHERTALRGEVEARQRDDGAVGWGARRVMRRMGWSVARSPSRPG